ncbi:MAG: hypothetical protein RL701_4994 [Pseudomonadota bacterium]
MATPTSTAARRSAGLAPVLLTTGGYYGTLAAVRALGRAGVRVVVADSDRLSVSRWSRFAHACLRPPDIRDEHDGFLEWLVAFGKKATERHVLLPTCDDTAWFYARHRETLQRYYHLTSCTLDAFYALLNKKQLMEACRAVGIDIPETRYLANESDIARVAEAATFPLLIKPATQILFKSREKGTIVTKPAAFAAAYGGFRKLTYTAPLQAFDASVAWPLVQQYIPGAQTNIYNLSGYIGRENSVFRASVKILQAREIGVGICFERADVDTALSDAVRALFERVGYHGIFEIEFIRANDRYYLIDANPRFYGEMAFEVARGMPLPLFAYFDALGDVEALRALVAQAQTLERADAPRAHVHRVGFEMFLGTQRLAGAWSAHQERVWRDWRTAQGKRISDAVYDAEDWLPSVIETANSVYRQFRYPAELFGRTAHYRLGSTR